MPSPGPSIRSSLTACDGDKMTIFKSVSTVFKLKLFISIERIDFREFYPVNINSDL